MQGMLVLLALAAHVDSRPVGEHLRHDGIAPPRTYGIWRQQVLLALSPALKAAQ